MAEVAAKAEEEAAAASAQKEQDKRPAGLRQAEADAAAGGATESRDKAESSSDDEGGVCTRRKLRLSNSDPVPTSNAKTAKPKIAAPPGPARGSSAVSNHGVSPTAKAKPNTGSSNVSTAGGGKTGNSSGGGGTGGQGGGSTAANPPVVAGDKGQRGKKCTDLPKFSTQLLQESPPHTITAWPLCGSIAR
jgi:hypothetical protein